MKTPYRIAFASLAGFIIAGIYLDTQVRWSGDAGLLFLPVTLYYGFVLAVLFSAIEELIFGPPKNKKIAAACLVVWLIWATSTRLNHLFGSDKNHQRYCDGVPVEQYQGPLPPNCRH
jgi:hypothetical protein